jgi:thiol-disulfide isomerase/thioredoxin
VRSISRYSQRLQQIFGVIILLLAVAMYLQYDTIIQTKLTALLPASSIESRITGVGNTANSIKSDESSSTNESELVSQGAAPEFTGIAHWINSDPLTIAQLKGKVVLIDFWTYSCINCIRTLPYVTKWYDTYKDQGLVIIGVHTPEFPFEKETKNVETAVKRFNISYPVAQDNSFGTWNAYGNQYWPAEYLIDQNGNIVYTHFGEGNYEKTENAIRQLLGRDTSAAATPEQAMVAQENASVKSPEMYFGIDRLQYLTKDQSPSSSPMHYVFPNSLKLNTFALDGDWRYDGEKVSLTNGTGKIRLHFSSGKLFMVAASSGSPAVLKIIVDGKAQPNVTESAKPAALAPCLLLPGSCWYFLC